MTISAALKAYLSTISDLTTKVSVRIYPGQVPQAPTYPYVVYSKITRTDGEINTPKGHYYQYYQFSIYAKTYKEIDDIGEIIIAAFKYKPKVSYSGIELINGSLLECRDLPFDPVGIYSGIVSVKISFAIV